MAEIPIVFPALGMAGDRPHRWLDDFSHAEDFSCASSYSVASRLGMIVVDSAGRCWEISSVVDLGMPGSFWGRVFRWLVGDRTHRLEQELIETPPMSLEEVKARVCESMQAFPDAWRDDEAIAGEDGPPRDEQEMLDELKARVRAAQTLPQIIYALSDQGLPG